MLGRLAAVLAGGARPVIVHTYHGHVLEGYFGPLQSAAYRDLERRLGRVSDRLIGVSQATVDDLVRLGVAPRAKFRVDPDRARSRAVPGGRAGAPGPSFAAEARRATGRGAPHLRRPARARSSGSTSCCGRSPARAGSAHRCGSRSSATARCASESRAARRRARDRRAGLLRRATAQTWSRWPPPPTWPC